CSASPRRQRGHRLTGWIKSSFICRRLSAETVSSFELRIIKVEELVCFIPLIYRPAGPCSFKEFTDFLTLTFKLSNLIVGSCSYRMMFLKISSIGEM
uniref:Uncharacterized protein n=1 Tax=Amphilophus citrinellus TaxID=61819 RepID=A0A3Q0SK61_AMPCI